MAILGSASEADMAGYATTSSHGLYTWQYDIFCGPGETVTAVQDEITALITTWRTPNGDSTSGQVALLTVKLLGYATQTASGIARLLTIASVESYPTRERLNLTFACAGFSYTV